MNKLLSFFKICAYVLAVIGGVGYTVYSNAYVIAVAILALGLMALPELTKAWKNMTE